MNTSTPRRWLIAGSLVWFVALGFAAGGPAIARARDASRQARHADDERAPQDAVANAAARVARGRRVFRFDTFGDEAFWGGTLKLHQAIEGARLGGVGPGVSPATALAVGLKVDVDALPRDVRAQLEHGGLNLNDPAVTVALLRLNAVVGVSGVFDSAGRLSSVGIQCAFCHSTVDDSAPSLCFGAIAPNPGTGCVGHRLDGWANRDLNVGAIVALAPDLTAFASLLGTDQTTVRNVLHSWGPGKFDAELILDGKTANPQRITDGVVTGTNVSAATLIPPAFGLGGVNLHTWTGWGSVPYWNAFVATLEMHGVGRFFDPRLNDPVQFPVAAAHGFGDLPHVRPDDDRVTATLTDLQAYQLAIASPRPPRGSVDQAAAARGDELFSGKAACNNCHVEPL